MAASSYEITEVEPEHIKTAAPTPASTAPMPAEPRTSSRSRSRMGRFADALRSEVLGTKMLDVMGPRSPSRERQRSASRSASRAGRSATPSGVAASSSAGKERSASRSMSRGREALGKAMKGGYTGDMLASMGPNAPGSRPATEPTKSTTTTSEAEHEKHESGMRAKISKALHGGYTGEMLGAMGPGAPGSRPEHEAAKPAA